MTFEVTQLRDIGVHHPPVTFEVTQLRERVIFDAGAAKDVAREVAATILRMLCENVAFEDSNSCESPVAEATGELAWEVTFVVL